MSDDVLVGDQEFSAITGFYRDVAGAKRGHPTVSTADINDVAWLNRLVEQQNDPAEQVRDRPLQTQSNTYAQSAGEEREGGEIHSDTGQREHHRDGDQGR